MWLGLEYCVTMGRFFDVIRALPRAGRVTLDVITASQRNGFHYG